MLKFRSKQEPLELEDRAFALLREILRSLPFVKGGSIVWRQKAASSQWQPDALLKIEVGGKRWRLVCEVKSSAQPRHVRVAILQLKDYLSRERNGNAYGVLLAPYLSEDAVAICNGAGIGYIDLAGNCRLSFDNVFIERSGKAKPPAARREQRSLFAPKSARILRVMLNDPSRAWKVVELAERAGVSLGQVSNVRQALLDREWGGAGGGKGFSIAAPHAVLDAWRQAYRPPRASRSRHYTLLHGAALDAALRAVFAEAGELGKLLFASFSAARWLAPFARVAGEFFYADAHGEELLKKHLRLEPASRGENVVIDRPKDDGVYFDSLEPKPGLRCTGLIQTYLDLAASGERGAEAADFLREQKIDPLWKGMP